MPSPFLTSTSGNPSEFYCSLCKTRLKTRLKTQFPRPVPPVEEWETVAKAAKVALLKEWDEHLADVHPRQWEREQRKRARRRES
jgi:hypothetical protein